ncbi:RagB/SusD family nutrient uptake outer membrane protein [Prevotella communis]|uniref:RagB/SusD family nutrient uptake outer membrane protein n=1 Tax=Prevotella communis TaxID=2913614 RepID=UPI001EDC6F72|nr:RagB/SusD family nutrient uptake outer membrane protein [Prevotella communis]UKK62434.1 RagB/SusD family nutrient uptake outer membrane protein [Prevotella communis]UKK65259.1 RagB/SusD family nutrient uptake outer membrane protein [Prevotella communis]
MKKIIYSLFVLLTMTTVGCDNYIDITPKGAVTVDSAQQYYELIATPMRAYYPSSFILLSDDQWVKESEILGYESISADGINFTFNEKADRTILPDNNLYENIYSFILRSNLVIDNVDKGQGSQELKTLAKAEARTFRAFDHFLAVNTFAKAYNPETAASDGGVCIMDHYDLEATPVKSTVAEVYNFIINELEQAVPLLEEKPVNIYHPNRAFGYALLAKVYLFHRDWAKAQEAAEQSLKLNSQLADYNLINDAGGTARYKNFAKDGNPEVLSYHWMAGWGSGEQVCLYHYGMISPELKSLFEANDLRYSLFLRDTGTSITSWFDSGSGAAIWTPAITNLDRFTYMSVGLRTAEVYLIMAEALARQNNLTEAANYVSQLRDKRIKGGNGHVDAPATQVEMVKIIIDERRKELLFGFNRFFDLKRLNIEPEYQKTITRVFPVQNISEAHPQQTYTLKPDSRLYIIPFPHSARDKNPNLTLNTDE